MLRIICQQLIGCVSFAGRRNVPVACTYNLSKNNRVLPNSSNLEIRCSGFRKWTRVTEIVNNQLFIANGIIAGNPYKFSVLIQEKGTGNKCYHIACANLFVILNFVI